MDVGILYNPRTGKPYRYRNGEIIDEELGIAPLIAAALPLLGGLLGGGGGGEGGGGGGILSSLGNIVGGLFGGGGGGGEAAARSDIVPASMAAALPALLGAGISPSQPKESVTRDSMIDVVRSLISSTPPPVREQVREVMEAIRGNENTQANLGAAIASSVDESMQPALAATTGALALAQTQRTATDEHRTIVSQADFRRDVRDGQRRMLERMGTLEGRMTGRRIVGPRAVDVLGGADLLSRSRG